MDDNSFIRRLADTEWPEFALLLLDEQPWRQVCERLAESPEMPRIVIRGAEDSELLIANTEQYDRAAYQKVSDWVNERLRPQGVRMDPYRCESCEQTFLWVHKKPRAWIVCDTCGGRAERTTT